jgi:signal transduction histidine kinase
VLVTTVATLAVAAVALLGPLEHSLRNAEKATLTTEVKGAWSGFAKLDLRYVLDVNPAANRSSSDYKAGVAQQDLLRRRQTDLGQRIGATVYLLGYFDAAGEHGHILAPPATSDVTDNDPFDDVAAAYRSQRSVYSFGSLNGTEYARAAIPFTIHYGERGGPLAVRYVLAVRKPLDEVTDAVAAVRNAFIFAALAGLVLTSILAIPLSGTIVRRLRRLRQAAIALAEGRPDVDVPVDRARDEVGDLARTFVLMQHQLRQQEEARRAFVATASHELRTPLTSLDGMLELLDEDLQQADPDLDDARSLVDSARAQSRRLSRLAADLLDLSRIDAQVQLRSEPVELGELSRAVMAEFELGTAERGIVTVLDDSAGSVWALGDPGSVARILRILLDNAVGVSPYQGQVRVELHNGDQASLSVQDGGPGVLPEERELIFERFQRGSGSVGRAGFGLGLAIGRELAQRMGGELVLEDMSAPGAKFTLRLPVAHAPEEEPIAVG